MSFVAEGDVSQFDESKKSAMVAVIASAAGVDESQVRCNVAAASVECDCIVQATSTSQASSAHNALSSNMGTAASANTLFSNAGVVVVTAATIYLAKFLEDPHMTDGRGGLFDFKGKDLVVYNLLTTKNTTVNGLFKHTDFRTDHRLIHGSFITAAYVATKVSDGRVLQIEYDATRPLFLPIKIGGAAPTIYHAPSSVSVDNVGISLKDRKMTITTSEWVVTAFSKMKKSIIRGSSCATGKCFLNVAVKPVTDVDHAVVAPHGLIGQAFDGGGIQRHSTHCKTHHTCHRVQGELRQPSLARVLTPCV